MCCWQYGSLIQTSKQHCLEEFRMRSKSRKEILIYKLLCAGQVYMHFLILVLFEPNAFVLNSTNKRTNIQEYSLYYSLKMCYYISDQ